MLALLNSKAIAEHWDLLAATATETLKLLPDVKPDFLNKLLERAMLGNVGCWLFHYGEDVVGGAISVASEDMITGQKSLLIYALHFWGIYPEKERFKDWLVFSKWAKEAGYESISLYTNNASLEEQAKRMHKAGAVFTQQYMSLAI